MKRFGGSILFFAFRKTSFYIFCLFIFVSISIGSIHLHAFGNPHIRIRMLRPVTLHGVCITRPMRQVRLCHCAKYFSLVS